MRLADFNLAKTKKLNKFLQIENEFIVIDSNIRIIFPPESALGNRIFAEKPVAIEIVLCFPQKIMNRFT